MNDLINNWSVQVAGMLVIAAATTAVFWIAQGFDAAFPVARCWPSPRWCISGGGARTRSR